MLHDAIIHSSIAILLIWLMKPNVFELRAPISKVAMLACYRDVVNLEKSQNMLTVITHSSIAILLIWLVCARTLFL